MRILGPLSSGVAAGSAGSATANQNSSQLVSGEVVGIYVKAEEVAKHFYETGEADVLVNVVDATNLERNLYLTLQLLERKLPLIVVLNKCDSARHKGIHIDIPRLSAMLVSTGNSAGGGYR